MSFYPLKVREVRKETDDCVSAAFEIPPEIKNVFRYEPGQYITLKLIIGEEEIRRSYSICSSPFVDGDFRIAVKHVKGGKGSAFLNKQLKPGDVLQVFPPAGSFFVPLDPRHRKNYIFFAGGSGITPVISILKSVLHKEPESRVILFYGNQDVSSVIFRQVLGEYESKYTGRCRIYHILNHREESDRIPDRELLTGILTPEKNLLLLRHFTDLSEQNEYLVCGPAGMMQSVSQTLHELGIKDSFIHLEYFSSVQQGNLPVLHSGDEFSGISIVTVIFDGVKTNLKVRSDQMILDAALEAGIEAPFSCRGGNCSTCRARLLEGKVSMLINYALSSDEVRNGYILTCQSRPGTPAVVVDYDNAR